MRKPFWRTSRNCWYVKDNAGRFIRLDADETKAETLWREMLAAGCYRGELATVVGIAQACLDELEPQMSSSAFAKVEHYVLSFVDSLPTGALASSITKGGVIRWLKEPKPGRRRKDGSTGNQRTWSPSAQVDAGRALTRVFRWALNEGHIQRNPLAGLRLETPQPRKGLVSPDIHRQLVLSCLSSKKSRSFALYLIALRCGARPQQIREVTAANVVAGRWVFEHHKTSKATRKALTVYLSPCLQTLTAILVRNRKKGPLFLNDLGKPWQKDTVCQRMRRLRLELGISSDVICYAYRHTFATDALVAGIDRATVAALLGHTSAAMVDRVYGHLDQATRHLVDASQRLAEKRAEDRH